MRLGQRDPAFGKVRIELERLLEQGNRGVQHPFAEPLCAQRAALQEQIVGRLAVGQPRNQRRLDGDGQRIAHRRSHRMGHAFLQREDFVQSAVEALAPGFEAGAAIDQVNVDPHLLALALHRSFDQVRGAQLAGDVGQRQVAAAEVERRGPARHPQLRHLAQRGDQFVNEAIGEVELFFAHPDRTERQYRDRGLAVSRRGRGEGLPGGFALAPAAQQAGMKVQIAVALQHRKALRNRPLQALFGLGAVPREPYGKAITELHLIEQAHCAKRGKLVRSAGMIAAPQGRFQFAKIAADGLVMEADPAAGDVNQARA